MGLRITSNFFIFVNSALGFFHDCQTLSKLSFLSFDVANQLKILLVIEYYHPENLELLGFLGFGLAMAEHLLIQELVYICVNFP